MQQKDYYQVAFASFLLLGTFSQTIKHWLAQLKAQLERRRIMGYQDMQIEQIYNRENIGSLVSVSGQMVSPNALDSRLAKNTKLVLRTHQKSDMFSNDSTQTQPSREIHHFQQASPIYLTDRDKQIEIKNILTTVFQPALEKIGETEEKKRLDAFEWFSSAVLLVGSVFSKVTGFSHLVRGIKIGVKESEFGIELDSIVNVLGKLSYDVQNKTFCIENPLYLCLSKGQLVKTLEKTIKEEKWAKFIFLYMSVGCGLFIGLKYMFQKKKIAK